MKVVILCGGQGTRIRDVSEVVPKPMLNIGEKPILWHIMSMYAAHGFKDFILCLGYKGWLIKEFFLNYRAMTSDLTLSLHKPTEVSFHKDGKELDWKITLAETGEDNMTGSRVWQARRHIPESDAHFMVTYGDGVGDINIQALVDFHQKQKSIATITGVQVAGRFGELEISDGRVHSFKEKPAKTEGRINAGFMVFDNKRAWQVFDSRTNLILEKEPLESLASQNELAVFNHDGFWQCMDTPREYARLNEIWRAGTAPWKTW